MPDLPYATALIVGAGPGISASLARSLRSAGLTVGLAARNVEKLAPLAAEIGATTFAADAAVPDAVARLFDEADAKIGVPDLVVYNPSARVRGRIVDIDAEEVRRSIEISAFGGFLVVQQAARRMEPKQHGAILLTGATASTKGFALSSAFAMGKFGLRGLAQSAARELGPQGIHVVHFVIDGGVRSAVRPDPADNPDSTLDPDGVAESYLAALRQPRSAWSWEIELRPWVERF
jgi:NAD(P)-dependent dehydrogenase (short-subunit alcohol dehydrogenase family)